MNQNWLDRLERKYSRFRIENLMGIVVLGMGLVYALNTILAGVLHMPLSYLMAFDRSAILHGQIWRLITFVFIPPNASLLFILISLYFYYVIGTSLEAQWGAFRFTVFYLCGVLGTIVSGMITGYATNEFLNLSLFLAYALLYPEREVLLFFILPIKVKYLGMLAAALLVLTFFGTRFWGKMALIAALINLALFFGEDAIRAYKNAKRRREWRNQFKR